MDLESNLPEIARETIEHLENAENVSKLTIDQDFVLAEHHL